MNKRLAILISLLLLAFLSGCSGSKTIKIRGIAERENNRPNMPKRIRINSQAYNYFVNGSIFESMGEYYMASQQYNQALNILPDSREIRLSYALSLKKLKDIRGALTEASIISPRDVKVWHLMGECYRALGILDSALYAYQEVITEDTLAVGAYYFIGAYYQQKGNLDSAIYAYENAARITKSFQAYQQLANLQLRVGRAEGAKKNYELSLEFDASSANVRSYLGLSVIYENSGDVKQALKYLEIAAQKSPADIMIQKRLLEYYMTGNNIEKAIEISRKAIPLAPEDISLMRSLGVIYYRVDSLNLADSIFTILLEKGGDLTVDHYYAGRIALMQKNYNKSKEHFTFLTNSIDTVLDGWLNLALIYRLQDSLELEAVTYDRSLKHINNIEDSLAVLFALADTESRLDNFQRAVELFEIILSFRPEHGKSLNYLGYMLAERGERLDYALDLIKRALVIEPENGAFVDSYGWVLYKLNNYESALRELLRAYKYMSTDPIILDHIGVVYQALGNALEARKYWEKALEIDPNNLEIKEKLDR